MEGYYMSIGIVTGASSGLGREYVRLLDKEHLDEIWLVARREGKLRELAEELSTPARIFSLDLRDRASLEELGQAISEEKPVIQYLINAAGFGRIGSEWEIDLKDSMDLIDLNCRAAVALTHLSIPYMPKGSHILEICSCSAFQPIPYLNVYAASKSFLFHYSRGLSAELAPLGICVSAVCPYWVKDTEFISAAMKTKNPARISGFPFPGKQKEIAERSFRAAKKGRTVITPDPVSTLHRLLTSLVPHSLLMTASRYFHGKNSTAGHK